MKKSNKGIIVLSAIMGVVVVGVISLLLWYFNETLAGQRFKNSIKSNTVGIERKVSVYSYDGKKLAEYQGNILVDDGDGGTISITQKGKKNIFANVGVIIEEKQ